MTIDHQRRRLASGLLAAPVLLTAASCRRGDDARLVRDVSQLDAIEVAGVLRPTSTEAVSAALERNQIPVSIGGGRFSMGGQIASAGSLHLDMRGMHRLLHLDVANRRVRVQVAPAHPGLHAHASIGDIQMQQAVHAAHVQMQRTGRRDLPTHAVATAADRDRNLIAFQCSGDGFSGGWAQYARDVDDVELTHIPH